MIGMSAARTLFIFTVLLPIDLALQPILAVAQQQTGPQATMANDDLAQVKQALQQEREQSERLARELAGAWRALRSQATKSADNAALNQQLGDLQQALQQAEASATAYQELLAQERARTQDLQQQLAARPDATPGEGHSTTAELSGARGATPVPATDKPATASLPTGDKPVTATAPSDGRPATAVAGQEPPPPSHGPVARVKLPDTGGATQVSATEKPATVPLPARDKPTMAAVPADDRPATLPGRPAAETPASAEVVRLLSRARVLLSQGNIGTARIVLDRAAESGNAPALFALAETYDPIILAAWGTFGTQGDAARARDLYAKALAGGVGAAGDRLNALRE
jgi:hypothetical protein